MTRKWIYISHLPSTDFPNSHTRARRESDKEDHPSYLHRSYRVAPIPFMRQWVLLSFCSHLFSLRPHLFFSSISFLISSISLKPTFDQPSLDRALHVPNLVPAIKTTPFLPNFEAPSMVVTMIFFFPCNYK